MPNKHLPMRLSPDEEAFLRHWMYDEVHYRDGVGAAKQLQLRHNVVSADLAALIAAAIPDPAEQEHAGQAAPGGEAPRWPWTSASLSARIEEARRLLARASDLCSGSRKTSDLPHDGSLTTSSRSAPQKQGCSLPKQPKHDDSGSLGCPDQDWSDLEKHFLRACRSKTTENKRFFGCGT